MVRRSTIIVFATLALVITLPNDVRAQQRQQSIAQDDCARWRTCRDVRNCAQACKLMQICGYRRADRDRDGIPCESVCRKRCP